MDDEAGESFNPAAFTLLGRGGAVGVILGSMRGEMAVRDVNEKTAIYHTMYELNSAFAAIVGHCDTLQQTRVLSYRYARLFQGFAQELQAEMNVEILQFMDGIETEDWRRFGKVRDKWEKYLRGSEPKRKKS
jgi:hypothetical protein